MRKQRMKYCGNFTRCLLFKGMLLLVLLSITTVKLYAQQFEWASAGGNLSAGYRGSVLDAKGNIIVTGYASQPFDFYNGDSFLYSSSGDSIEVQAFNRPMFIVSFDVSGKINWKREVRGGGDPVGIGIDSKNNIIVLACTNSRWRAEFPELGKRVVESGQHYLYTLDEEGYPVSVVADTNNVMKNPSSFFVTGDNKIVIADSKIISSRNAAGRYEEILYSSVSMLDRAFHPAWEQLVKRGSGSTFDPDCLIDVAENGDIYFSTSVFKDADFGKGKIFTAPVVDSVTKYNVPYEAYLACYSKNGNLKWVNRSGGKANFYSIKAVKNGVLAGGTIVNNGVFFGNKADTSQNKRMFLASFNTKGNLAWVKTSIANRVTGITTDHDDNIYAVVESRIAYPNVMVYEGDTLRNAYEALIIASYKSNGNFRWVKNCKVPMSTNTLPQIKVDGCGNIYISGEMWSVMRSKMNWFDAAFVKGDGYGAGAYVAKLKNTLPDKIAEKIANKKNVCIISPAPWTLYNYPNPFSDQTTLRYKVTYDDKNVSMFVYDLNGRLLSNVFTNKPHKAGTYTSRFSAALLSKGVYIAVLKGTEAVATERLVVQ